MTSLLTVDSLISLITLSLLEIVLGIDNVIFVSILMGRLKEEQKLLSRRIWMILGITVRVLLLLALGWLVANGNKELFGLNLNGHHYGFNLRNMIMLFGGLFLLYKTVKEIAVGMARHVEIMIVAVIIAMVIMFFFSEKISNFIHKHPTLKMLALSFLLMVGFSLFFEGLQPIHGSHIDKGYIYFAMAFSFGVEMLNMRMKRKTVPVTLHEPVIKKDN